MEYKWTRPQHMEQNASWRTAPPATVIFFSAHSSQLGGSPASAAAQPPQPDPCKILARSFGSSQALFCFSSLPTVSLILVLDLSPAQIHEGTLESTMPLLSGLSNAMETLRGARESQIPCCCSSLFHLHAA